MEFETAGTGSIKGIPTSVIEIQAKNLNLKYEQYNTIASGTAYTIDDSNWHEYVTVGVRKWATVNVGANAPEESGEYFMWGGTTGYVYNGIDNDWYSFPNPPDSVLLEDGFCWKNCPHTQGEYTEENKNVFTKYTGDNSDYAFSSTADGKSILDLNDDAANVKWGGAWRMPTQAEFSAMIIKVKDAFASGQHFGDDDSHTIFLPAAGRGEGKSLSGSDLRYWSSSLASFPNTAFSLFFASDQDEPTLWEPSPRSWGYTIRAIVDEPVAENQ